MDQPVKLLERKGIIQLFGVGLILAPFVNTALIIYTRMQSSKVVWANISIINILKNAGWDGYIISLLSIVIGMIMLKGSTKAWRAVLFLIGFHTAVQILNYKTSAAGNILWWPFFLINSTLFIFIADQLVWKIQVPVKKPTKPEFPLGLEPMVAPTPAVALNTPAAATPKIIHLRTNKKIFLRHGAQAKPWAEIKNMNSKGFEAYNLQPLTDQMAIEIAQRNVVLKLSNGLILYAQLKRQFDTIYYFEFCNQNEQHDQLINSWFRKIAV